MSSSQVSTMCLQPRTIERESSLLTTSWSEGVYQFPFPVSTMCLQPRMSGFRQGAGAVEVRVQVAYMPGFRVQVSTICLFARMCLPQQHVTGVPRS